MLTNGLHKQCYIKQILYYKKTIILINYYMLYQETVSKTDLEWDLVAGWFRELIIEETFTLRLLL